MRVEIVHPTGPTVRHFAECVVQVLDLVFFVLIVLHVEGEGVIVERRAAV